MMLSEKVVPTALKSFCKATSMFFLRSASGFRVWSRDVLSLWFGGTFCLGELPCGLLEVALRSCPFLSSCSGKRVLLFMVGVIILSVLVSLY